ncbi:putative flavo protein [Microthyrium microscopicum]|uniref:Putative flavo protein n=1 Tax=Microthyrium microscopicum TaxID=703497 RepID=A0A6A6U7B3_9PEZI|nr:putative flavo protein [Microthyrium microscopicum]
MKMNEAMTTGGQARRDSVISRHDVPEIVEHDLLIIGAGISGVNMAYRFQERFPHMSYRVLEARQDIGGTWDLMRYPGIRSDSDLYTFGFEWRPWPERIPIAGGDKILKYMKDSAAEFGIDKKICLGSTVLEAKWSSKRQAWTLAVQQARTGSAQELRYYRAKFLVYASGFYDYQKPMPAVIPGLKENFMGQVYHPQFWPQNANYTGKKVAVIGSGATAITLIPALARLAAKVVMVQRSPTYIMSMNNSVAYQWWERFLPIALQQRIRRLMFVLMSAIMTRIPASWMRPFLKRNTQRALPKHIPYDPHFKPTYAPFSQRVCLCPDGDFFEALREGKADVATGEIKTVTEDSIILKSGQRIEADVIITATGLNLMFGGKVAMYVDGRLMKWNEKYMWRGAGMQDFPNCAIVRGYTKASWTLGADVTAYLVCRLISHMEKEGLSSATPKVAQKEVILPTKQPGIGGLTSTYIMRGKDALPRESDRTPWNGREDYLKELWHAKYGNITQGVHFTPSGDYGIYGNIMFLSR